MARKTAPRASQLSLEFMVGGASPSPAAPAVETPAPPRSNEFAGLFEKITQEQHRSPWIITTPGKAGQLEGAVMQIKRDMAALKSDTCTGSLVEFLENRVQRYRLWAQQLTQEIEEEQCLSNP